MTRGYITTFIAVKVRIIKSEIMEKFFHSILFLKLHQISFEMINKLTVFFHLANSFHRFHINYLAITNLPPQKIILLIKLQ